MAHEGYRTNSTATGQLIMPTDLERAGDFSQQLRSKRQPRGHLRPVDDAAEPERIGLRPGRVCRERDSSEPHQHGREQHHRVMPHATDQRSGANGISNYQLTSQIPTEAEQLRLQGRAQVERQGVDHRASISTRTPTRRIRISGEKSSRAPVPIRETRCGGFT